MFSARTLRARAPNRLAIALDKERAAGRAILDLSVSNPTVAGIPYARDAILAALADPRALTYEPHPFGLPSAREAIAGFMTRNGVEVPPERIVLTASTSEAYSYVLKLLCDPGDEVLVPQPSYPLFEHLAALECVRLVPYRLAYDGEWHIDLGSVESAVRARTRAIFIVSPNNPTGSYVKRDELDALARIGLPLVSDEVFATYAFSGDERRCRSALESTASLVFALGGLSKLGALPQMKLAWTCIGGAPAIAGEAIARLELVADTFLSPSTPVQIALPALLASRGEAEAAIKQRTKSNLRALERAIQPGSAASALRVEGGWYVIMRLPGTRTEEQWVLSFLEEDAVLVQPGWFYDFEREAFIVLSLLTPEKDFADGVRRIVDRVG